MGLLSPTPTPYDPLQWDELPLPEKLKWVCRAWVIQGYGTPPPIYAAYGLKIAGYIGGWLFFCSLSPALGDRAMVVASSRVREGDPVESAV